ncbi:unnamed protein product [Pylaiella littoralis]
MAHRLAAIAGLAWLSTAFAFQPQVSAHVAMQMSASATQTSTVTSLPPASSRPSTRSSAWATPIGGKRRERRERRHLPWPLRAASGAAADGSNETPEVPTVLGVHDPRNRKTPSEIKAVAGSKNDEEKNGAPLKRAFRRVGRFFGAGKELPNIKELGLYAILSYGFVSNASYSICVGLAWFAASKKTGLSPLAPDQWQFFLVSYAALFAINNVLRVPRFALSISLAPAFDRFIAFLMRKTGRGKAFATGLCVFFVNVLGTITLMTTGVLLASLFSGVPFWPVR